jgi:hypothetical protein
MTKREEYQWTFQVKDVVNFEGTEISVYSNTHKGALRKIKNMRLPQLEKMEDMEDSLRLTFVVEIREDINIEDNAEPVKDEPNDDED